MRHEGVGFRPALPPATARAAKAVRPAKLKQIIPASRLGRKLGLQFQQISRIILHGQKHHKLWLRQSNKYPIGKEETQMRTNDKTPAGIQNVLFVALACIGLFVLTPRPGRAQIALGTSVLNGTVTDVSGAVVPNAKVTISSAATGISRTFVTNSSGRYYISQLIPGVYSVSVEARGFENAVLSGITLYVGQTSTENFRLQLGTVHQTVSVTGQLTLLNTSNGQLGTVVTGTLMTQLPLNGRNFMNLNLLSPGAIEDDERL
jgi:hypothetical protein